jgi:hypothetical protein
MLDDWVGAWLRWSGGSPCFRIYGKVTSEPAWRVIDVLATHRRDLGSGWPLWAGSCITWTDRLICLGWDLAREILREQCVEPASRDYPLAVAAGRLRDPARRLQAGAGAGIRFSEILAHECGHTWQALRLGPVYLPLVGMVTFFREGPYPWNYFENQASEVGRFGGLVNGSVCGQLMDELGPR